MDNQDELVIKKLLKENIEFKRAYKTHKECEDKLAKLQKRPHLSVKEEAEADKLKKTKLAKKDEMLKMISAVASS